MLYLTTGTNGAGKTLLTIKLVRDRQLAENRPVCYNGRFEPVEGGELAGWKKIDFVDWQKEPDGTIFIIDEAHNDLPVRQPGSTVPDAVKMLAEHRRRGFDFYLISQHPQNIDSFVRRLIGAPGWHRHIKRTFGADMVSVLTWGAVNPNCEKDGSGKSAEVSMQAFPKEVYSWYRSASLHTTKKRIPKAVWLLAACALILPLVIWFGVSTLMSKTDAKADAKAATPPAEAPAPAAPPAVVVGTALSADEYVNARTPRIPDFAHTAAAYDQVTQPTVAPYPAACVSMGKTCKCYSQQATLLQVSGAVCLQIVAQGFFMDWAKVQEQLPQQQAPPQPVLISDEQPRKVRPASVPPAPQPEPDKVTQADVVETQWRNPAMANFGGATRR